MKREIKFRAWDTKTKKMIAEGFHVIGEVTMFSMIEQYIFENLEGVESLLRLNDVALMQFIGLKEKNGKEIYEEDILEGIYRYEVRFDFSEGIFYAYNSKGGLSFKDMAFMANGMKVIGNFYENPELLK